MINFTKKLIEIAIHIHVSLEHGVSATSDVHDVVRPRMYSTEDEANLSFGLENLSMEDDDEDVTPILPVSAVQLQPSQAITGIYK